MCHEYWGHIYTKNLFVCLSEIEISPGILNFYLLSLAMLTLRQCT